jgi:hypothetical protein
VITAEKKHKRRHDGASQSRWHVVGDIPGLEANHAAPGGVAEVGHGGGLFGAGIPHHARRGADLFDHDAAAPPAIFEGASPRRVEVDAIGLCRDGDERRSLRLAPCPVRLVDVGTPSSGESTSRSGSSSRRPAAGSQCDIVETSHVRRMPCRLELALFGETAIDAEKAKPNADMIQSSAVRRVG